MYRLRSGLGDSLADRIVTSAGGYVLHLSPDELDSERFERLVRQAETAGAAIDSYTALAHIEEALSLWRIDPYEEFSGEAWIATEQTRLNDVHVRAIEQRAESLIYLDRGAEAGGELEPLIAGHPYRERPRQLLMIAFYKSGRSTSGIPGLPRSATRRDGARPVC